MKLKWIKHDIYFGTWIAENPKGIEYRIECRNYTGTIELNASINTDGMGRTLGWCPNLQIAKKRCQDMEDYFDTHKIILR